MQGMGGQGFPIRLQVGYIHGCSSKKPDQMLEKYPLCDNCLGRQFALLGYGLENNRRGEAIKLALTLQAAALATEKKPESIKTLKVLATNGFSQLAQTTLQHLKKRLPKTESKTCFLCDDKFQLHR